jgi:hypothetical protein
LATGSLTFLAMTAFAQATPPAHADISPSANGPMKPRPQPTGPQGPTSHTEDGKLDLSGNWSPSATRQNVDSGASLKVVSEAIPFQPWAEELYLERNGNISKDDPEGQCMPPGLRRKTTAVYPFRIVETPKLILILYEGGAQVWRQIFMDGRQHPVDRKPTRLGHSIGHWEGDTLVVDSVGFDGEAWLDEFGLPTTESLHLIEHFRRPDLGHLEIDNIVDDPKAYTKPWSFTTHPVMLKGGFMDYICQEK